MNSFEENLHNIKLKYIGKEVKLHASILDIMYTPQRIEEIKPNNYMVNGYIVDCEFITDPINGEEFCLGIKYIIKPLISEKTITLRKDEFELTEEN